MPPTPHAYLPINRRLPLREQPDSGHNRWHPDIPPAVRVEPGQVVGLETRDAFDGQIQPGTAAEDLRRLDLNLVHPLTGPVYVEGAEPGDLLEVEIVEIVPERYGFTVQVPGFGFLRDAFPEPFIAHWELDGRFAVSLQLPRVRVPAAPFMGVMGVAPSRELLARINRRETDLKGRGGMVLLPNAAGAVPAQAETAGEAMRTIAPHETGGNVDIKQLTRGTKLRIPVYVPGALFSAGDAHYAQGDGESCGTAVEMAATCYCSFRVVKGLAAAGNIRDVQFSRDTLAPELAPPRRYFATTGQSHTREGVNHSEDATLAARNALLNMIDHLVLEHGYTRPQAYAITSVAVDLKISELVDVPNFVVSAVLPLDIFV